MIYKSCPETSVSGQLLSTDSLFAANWYSLAYGARTCYIRHCRLLPVCGSRRKLHSLIFSGNFLHSPKGKIPHPLSSFPIFSILLQISAARSFSFLAFPFPLSPFQSMGSKLWLGENTEGFGEIFFSFLLFLFLFLSIKFVAKN